MKNIEIDDSLSLTVETSVKEYLDYSLNNFETFGLCEKSTQTDMTGRDLDLIVSRICLVNLESKLKENNDNHTNNTPKKNKNNQKEKHNNQDNFKKENENHLQHKRKREENINNNNQNLPVKDIINKIIDESVNKSEGGKKIIKKKIDGYIVFKEEYYQTHKAKNEEDLEKNCKNEWNELSKDVKKIYNVNAENENKRLKKELKQQRKNEKNNI